jgi:hypothetical protein
MRSLINSSVEDLTSMLPLLRLTKELADSGAVPPAGRELYRNICRGIALLRPDGRVEFRFTPKAAALLERAHER